MWPYIVKEICDYFKKQMQKLEAELSERLTIIMLVKCFSRKAYLLFSRGLDYKLQLECLK